MNAQARKEASSGKAKDASEATARIRRHGHKVRRRAHQPMRDIRQPRQSTEPYSGERGRKAKNEYHCVVSRLGDTRQRGAIEAREPARHQGPNDAQKETKREETQISASLDDRRQLIGWMRRKD